MPSKIAKRPNDGSKNIQHRTTSAIFASSGRKLERGQSALSNLYRVGLSPTVECKLSRIMGKWSLPQRSSWTFHEKSNQRPRQIQNTQENHGLMMSAKMPSKIAKRPNYGSKNIQHRTSSAIFASFLQILWFKIQYSFFLLLLKFLKFGIVILGRRVLWKYLA
jgi:ribosomal protein L32